MYGYQEREEVIFSTDQTTTHDSDLQRFNLSDITMTVDHAAVLKRGLAFSGFQPIWVGKGSEFICEEIGPQERAQGQNHSAFEVRHL